MNVSIFKSLVFNIFLSVLDACFGIVFSKNQLQRLKKIEQNTNHLNKLGIWECAPKKSKGKGSGKHTVSLDRNQLPCQKGKNGMNFFVSFT